MWFGHAAAVALVRDMAVRTEAKLDSHTEDCGRRYTSLEQKIDASVAERRDHAVGLGQRLDAQDADMSDLKKLAFRIILSVFGGTVLLLGAVAGLWLHAAGVMK